MGPSAQSPVNGGSSQTTKDPKIGQNAPAVVVEEPNGDGVVSSRKITTLRDATQRSTALYRTELGSSTNEFLESCTSVEEFFDFVAGIRLREMPHHGSRWDKVLKWAEFFAAQVFGYSQEVNQFASHSEQAASIIWASCRSLLQLGPQYVSVLEKAFGVFYSCGLSLGFFLRHHELLHSTPELQVILAASFTDLLKLVTGIHIYYGLKQLSVYFSVRGFDELFGRSIELFNGNVDHFTDTIWATRLESLAKPGDVSVDLVRDFLTPHDRVTRLLAVTRNIRKTRADFTCEWFDRHLTDFQRSGKELLLVTGKPGSGKSVLSDFVVEQLQATTGRRASEVITYTIDPDLKTELTSLSVVKGLLLQLLQLKVGDNSLYKSLAAAYQLSVRGSPAAQVEGALWAALENLHGDRNQTIVLDGVEHLKGGESEVFKLLGRLNSVASKHSKTKSIVFSQPLSKSVAPNYTHFQINNENIRQDLHYFVESLLASTSSFNVLSQQDKATITSKIVQGADGSFEWIDQVVSILKTETTSQAILSRLDAAPKTLREVLELKLSSVDLKQRDTRSLLAWSLASERPLLVTEIKSLFEIDPSTCSIVPRTTRIEDEIVKSAIFDIRHGFVRFRNPTIKQIFTDRASSVTDFKNTGAFPFHIQEAHYDLTLRLLAHVKIHLTRPTQPTVSPLNDYELDELFSSYNLLQYSARYWSLHFQSSPMHEPSVSHKLTQGFKHVFPSKTLLAVIEGSTYQYQYYPTQDAINYHLLTLSLRKTVLGQASEPALQTLLNLAVLKSVIIRQDEVNEYYYQAWNQAITLKLTSIATICAHRYIESTSTITMKSKSDVSAHRSELLQYIITTLRETRASSGELLNYVELIVSLYLAIGESEKATQYQRELYDLNVSIHGRYAPQTVRSREGLVTTLQKSTKTSEINEITESNYLEAIRTLDATDQKRLALSWSMIDLCEKQKDTNRLEEIIVSLWQSLTRSSIATKDTSVQEKKIDVALRYVEFLKQHNRKIEAENVLRGVWTDLEHQETQSDAIVQRTKKVGDQLQILGSLVVARSVFAKLWAYYVKTGQQSSSEATAVSTSLNQATRDVTEAETTHETTTLREIFDSVMTTSTTKTISVKTVETSVTLIETYYREQRWTELVKVGTLTLSRLWPDYSSKEPTVQVPSTYLTQILLVLNRLAISYVKLRQFESAELTYRRIFYSVKATPNSSDDLLLSSSEDLIKFYRSHSMIEKLILIYRDLALEVEKRHGKTNQLTIKYLYILGDQATHANNTKEAEFAYSRIHANLGSDICHRDAIKAALALGTVYEQQHQFASALKVYNSLWQMFIKHGKDYALKPDFADDLYQKHVRITKQESKADYSTLRQLAVDYRKALVRFYGVSHECTLKATMHLAELNEEKEENIEEAIAMYEEADQKSRDLPKGQVSDSILASIRGARTRLPHLYSTTKLAHSPKAITLYDEEFQKSHPKQGYAHRDSLMWLSLLAVAHTKQGNAQSTAKATSTLETSIVHILKNEKSSQRLSESAYNLAAIYEKAGLKAEAEKIMRELRSQIIFGASELSKSFALASDTNLDRRTWVFYVSFETTLRGNRHQYSSVFADLINEVFLYEAYKRVVSQKAPFLTTLGYSSRLLQFMRDINDEPSCAKVDKEVIEYFATNLNASKTVNATILRQFFELVNAEIYKQDLDISVLKSGSQSVLSYRDKGQFEETLDLASLVDKFQRIVGGYSNLEKISYGLKLSLALSSHGKTGVEDQKLRTSMLSLSTSIMKEIIKSAKSAKLILSEIPLEELNEVSGLLGDQQNLEDLEWILYTLWEARHTQTWSSSIVVNLGRRLVETQFARGHHAAATTLLEDMCYNLRRVWGALDATTLEMHVLLSSFYTMTQNYRKAMLVHEDVLRDSVSDKGEGLPQAEACAIALQHLELLKRAYQRLGGWDKEAQVYVDLYQQLAHVFASEEGWKKGSSQIQSVEKWQPKGADSLGTWTSPETFEFISNSGTRKHANNLRKSSGTWTMNGHFHGHRLSRSFSSRSVSTQ